jgi:hypothetical protein
VIIFRSGDSLRIFAKLIPVSSLESGLNNVDCGFCANADSKLKKNRCRYSNLFFKMAGKLSSAIQPNVS